MSAGETKRSIAELWDRFQKLENYITTEKILDSWGKKGRDGLSYDGRNHENDWNEFLSIRSELLERCRDVGLVNFVQCDTVMGIFVTDGDALLDRNDLKDLSAACAFWALELEQREKEASNG
jgi:hypothetical protein